jgi:hypothetical protein
LVTLVLALIVTVARAVISWWLITGGFASTQILVNLVTIFVATLAGPRECQHADHCGDYLRESNRWPGHQVSDSRHAISARDVVDSNRYACAAMQSLCIAEGHAFGSG